MNARRRDPKRKGFPDNLYMKADGYFWYRNPQSGKTKGLGRDRATAFREARNANAALAAMQPSSLVDWVKGTPSHSLADWVKEYEKIWTEREKPAKSTASAVKRYIKHIAAADFAWMQMSDITAQHISGFIDGIKSKSIAINMRSRLSDIFRTAATKGLISQNPVTITYTPDYKVMRDRLSIEQFKAIRDEAPDWLRNAMNLALLTAQRREDLTNIMFADAKDGFLHVIQGKSGGMTKLRIDTRIRLEAVGMSIEDVIKQCRDNVVSKYLIHHSKTQATHKAGDKLTPQGLTNAFAAARDKAKIEIGEGRTPPSFHEIRSLAERLYKTEYGATFAQSMLGHKNAKTTAIYDDLRGSAWQEISVK